MEPVDGDRDIKTLCAYSVSNFYKDTSLRAIFDEHSHVVSDKGATGSCASDRSMGSPAASQRSVLNHRAAVCGGSTAAAIASVA